MTKPFENSGSEKEFFRTSIGERKWISTLSPQ